MVTSSFFPSSHFLPGPFPAKQIFFFLRQEESGIPTCFSCIIFLEDLYLHCAHYTHFASLTTVYIWTKEFFQFLELPNRSKLKEIPNLVNPRGPEKLWLCPQRSASRGTEEDGEGVCGGWIQVQGGDGGRGTEYTQASGFLVTQLKPSGIQSQLPLIFRLYDLGKAT